MGEFEDLPHRLDNWTFDTVVNVVKKYEYEPVTFDYKEVLNATNSDDRNNHNIAIRRTVCSMANTSSGFVLFGVRDRKTKVSNLEDRIVGIPIGGDLRKEFGNKMEVIQPEIHFETVPRAIPLPTTPTKGIFIVYIPLSQRRPHMIEGAYWKRGDGGNAISMTHYEVREQMLYTENRLRKINLLRLELVFYDKLLGSALGVSNLALIPYRLDISAFKPIIADICDLVSDKMISDLLTIHMVATTANNILDQLSLGKGVYSVFSETVTQGHKLIFECLDSLNKQFGPLIYSEE
jgi:hypothetical protein